jgi:serine/threonine-protein kinase
MTSTVPSEEDRGLARAAVSRRVLTRGQVDAALRDAAGQGVPLARILVEQGLLTGEEARDLARLGRSRPALFAELAVESGLATDEEVRDALDFKNRLAGRDVVRPVGEILVERNILSPGQVDELLARQGKAVRLCVVCGYRFNARLDRPASCPECGIEITGATPAGGIPPYQIHEELGRGPHGAVFRALPAAGGPAVAFKRLHAPRGLDASLEALPNLRHPNVAAVAAVGVYEKSAWIASELVHGIPLLDHVIGSIRLPGEEALLLLKQVAAALQAAHSRGLVHGNLRASNVFVGEHRGVKVADFGLVRPGAAPPELLPYWAPERDARPVGPASDLYACGVLWYFMLAGRLPWVAASPDELRILRSAGRAPALPKAAPGGADAVFRKLTAFEPSLRYKSAAALIEDLDLIANGRRPVALTELIPPSSRGR